MYIEPAFVMPALLTAFMGHGLQVPEAKAAPSRGLGRAIAVIDDVDGDKLADLLVAAPNSRSRAGEGSAFAFSSRTGAVLHVFEGSGGGVRFATSVAGLGDVDGDGRSDVAIGAGDQVVRGSSGPGYVRIYSSGDWKLLHDVASPCDLEGRFDRFGWALSSAGDLDRDGSSDVIVGAPLGFRAGSTSSSGTAFVISGRSGAVLRQFDGTSTDRVSRNVRFFGSLVLTLGDVDLDGSPDYVMTSPYGNPVKPGTAGQESTIQNAVRGSVTIVSGASGATLSARTTDSGCGSFGESAALLGDVDGDRVSDLAVSAEDACVRVLSGKSSEVLSTIRELAPGGYVEGFGSSLAGVGDVDGDGAPDVAVGCAEFSSDSGDDYYAAVFSGRSGKVLRYYGTDRKHVVVGDTLGDLDGDGAPEFVFGLPEIDQVVIVSGAHSGAERIARADWKVVHTLTPPTTR